MLYINCPHCGMRSQNEFSYGGDASVKRPELNKEISGCRQWIMVERDTATHEIFRTFKANEEVA